MDNKTPATIEITNNRMFIPPVLSFMDALVSAHREMEITRYDKLRYIVTELLVDRIDHAYPGEHGKLFIDFSLRDGYFEISVRDKGVPEWIDFDRTPQPDEKNLSKMVLDLCIDGAGIEKLGKNGQRIFVRQKIRNPFQFRLPQPYPETVALDTNLTIRAVTTQQDAIEAIRCIYSEYGYSYAYEKFYYVDQLLEMIQRGEVMSFLAVNDHGQTAGHFALVNSELYPGMPELSTVVTRKEFRGLGLFSKFIDHSVQIAQEKGWHGIMGQPVAFHPMSQKAFLRGGFTPTSLLLSYINADIESEYNRDGRRLDLFACVRRIGLRPACVLYPPQVLCPLVQNIYDRLGFDYTLSSQTAAASSTVISIDSNASLNMKRVILTESGADVEKTLMRAVEDSIRQKHEMVELFISMRSDTCATGYTAAAACRFSLSGLMPGGEKDDYIVMQLLLKSPRRYDQLVTVGAFESLTNEILQLVEEPQKEDIYEL